jgi:hypothetical protein
VSGIWTLCELWKKRVLKWITIILAWIILEKMEGKHILYKKIKGSVKGCGKVSFALHSF